MADSCVKERKEYILASKEEEEAKSKLNLTLESLTNETPPHFDRTAYEDWLEKEETSKLKLKAFIDCLAKHAKSK